MSEEHAQASGGTVRTRERLLAETFVMLADTLVDDYDVVDLLDSLVRSCVDLLGVTAAGLMLKDQKDSLAVVASSSEESRLLEVYQLQSDAGPCLETVKTGNSVMSEDLEQDRGRWPIFVDTAVAAGFHSVVAVPMRLRDQTIGGLNLFNASAGRMEDDDRQLAQALADVATIGILAQRSAYRSSRLVEQCSLPSTAGCWWSRPRGSWPNAKGSTWTPLFWRSANMPVTTASSWPTSRFPSCAQEYDRG